MRPRSRRKGKALGADLDREGDERSGVGAERLDRRDCCSGVGADATSRVVMNSRWTAICLLLAPLALLVATSRDVMDTHT